MKAKLIRSEPVRPEAYGEAANAWPVYSKDPKYRMCPPGTIVEHKHAFWLVKNGQATPEDDECRAACGHLTNQQIAGKLEKLEVLEAAQMTGDPNIDAPRKDESTDDE